MFKMYLVILSILTLSTFAYADMGAIVPVSDVDLSEPGQKAIIFYNGTEEILILETDLNASESTGALRFIPLPSEPQVSLAPKGCFDALNKLIKKYNIKYVVQYKGPMGIREGEAVELRFHKKLGVHDITVIKVNDATHFRKWVNDYFKKKGLPQRDAYPEIESIVSDYVARGIVYFAFDFVKISEDVISIEPLTYRFKSAKMYYPLKTSNIFAGTGRIDLVIFAKYAKRWLTGGVGFLASTSVAINPEELINIYPEISDFFKGERIVLQAFKREGKLDFEYDIFTDYNSGLEELKPFRGIDRPKQVNR